MTKDEILARYSGWTFQAPATPEQLTQLEQTLDLTLPADLRAALLISNGLSIEIPECFFENYAYYSIDRLISDTQHFRIWWEEEHEIKLPFDSHQILIFNMDITGNPFGIMQIPGDAHSTFLFLDHESGEAGPLKNMTLFDFVLSSAEMAEE